MKTYIIYVPADQINEPTMLSERFALSQGFKSVKAAELFADKSGYQVHTLLKAHNQIAAKARFLQYRRTQAENEWQTSLEKPTTNN